jgi:hypothetical protein
MATNAVKKMVFPRIYTPGRGSGATANSSIQELNFKSAFDFTDVDLLYEDNRLKTFFLWPQWSNAQPADLAKNGMYFIGKEDTVCCVECASTFTNWKAGETPSERHTRTSPYCPMVTEIGNRNVPRLRTKEEKKSPRPAAVSVAEAAAEIEGATATPSTNLPSAADLVLAPETKSSSPTSSSC